MRERDGETVLREDLAVIGVEAETTSRRVPADQFCMRLILTSQRLIVRKPTWSDIRRAMNSVGGLDRGPFEVDLKDIRRLWKWQPEFSGPPMVQASQRSFTIALIIGAAPSRLKYAPVDLVREHFEAIEAAWLSARSGAPEHEHSA